MSKRADVIRAARAYIGTPFRHQGRLKGVAVDCAGVVMCVAEELGIRDKHGEPILRNTCINYPPNWIGNEAHEECKKRLITRIEPFHVSRFGEIVPGDVVTMTFSAREGNTTHAAIVTLQNGRIAVVHAYNGMGTESRVIENPIDGKWMRRIRGVFYFPGLED
jgi:cell wall-associated NlpC family hydrolase